VRLLSVVLVLALAACGGGDGPTNPNGDGVTNFTAKIDGVDWNAEYAPVVSNPQAGMYVISGMRVTGATYTMAFTLHNITGPGTYPLGVNLQVFGGTALLSDASSGWNTQLDGAAGEIVITTLTATRIVATFEFVGSPLTNTAATRTVTEGQFDITFTAGSGPVTAANRGSSMTGSISGPFTAAQVTHQLTNIGGATPTLIIIGHNLIRSITISLANVTAAGTYTLSAGSSRTITASTDPSSITAVRTSGLAGGSGSVIIGTLTADRIQGTYTATLVPAAGSTVAGNLTISGEFNLGRGGP
jgi:hypothetical protein